MGPACSKDIRVEIWAFPLRYTLDQLRRAGWAVGVSGSYLAAGAAAAQLAAGLLACVALSLSLACSAHRGTAAGQWDVLHRRCALAQRLACYWGVEVWAFPLRYNLHKWFVKLDVLWVLEYWYWNWWQDRFKEHWSAISIKIPYKIKSKIEGTITDHGQWPSSWKGASSLFGWRRDQEGWKDDHGSVCQGEFSF